MRDVFAAVLKEQRGTGAAVAAWHDGRWIVDLWGGTATADGSRVWMQDSIVQPYSVSKPFAAMCVLLLVDRGLVDLDAPVQRYWPEFTAPGNGPPRPLAPGRRRRARHARRHRRLLRLGSSVRAARGPATSMAARHRARRVGALLRPSRRRDRAPRRRTHARGIPSRRVLRARGTRFRRSASRPMNRRAQSS